MSVIRDAVSSGKLSPEDAELAVRSGLAAAEKARAEVIAEGIRQINAIAEKVGVKVTIDVKSGVNRKVPPKYGDSEGNTWSGRGVKPKWLKARLEAGEKLEDFMLVSVPVAEASS